MRPRKAFYLFIICLLPALNTLADDAALQSAIQARSPGVLLEESIAVGQAAVQAKHNSAYSMELRPSISENDAGLALRIYLPECWSRNRLHEQLTLVAESEQLRVAALEWQELLGVYRDFCTYRMCRKQLSLYAAELKTFEPWLAQADLSVKQNQFTVTDRAKLYSQYLDLLNDREKVEMELFGIRRRLHVALGSQADLDRLSESAVVAMLTRTELALLMRQALANRADYRRLDVEARGFGAAEIAARSEEGFRLKYIQPEYSVDFDGDHEQNWGISASFVLPWGTRNSGAAVYQQQRMLAEAEMDQQRRIMEERLEVLLKVSDVFKEQNERRNRLVQPLVERLEADLGMLDNLPLAQLRDLVAIRERLLSTALQSVKADCERELLAVDFAEEVGTLEE